MYLAEHRRSTVVYIVILHFSIIQIAEKSFAIHPSIRQFVQKYVNFIFTD